MAAACVTLTGCKALGATDDHFPDPVGAARDAVAAHDCRLVAVYAYSVYFPGVDLGWSEIEEKYGGVIIPFTSDDARGPKEHAFNEAAARFAKAYNAEVLKAGRDGKCATDYKPPFSELPVWASPRP